MSEEKKKRKRNVPSYSLKLRLLTSEEDERLLDKRFRIATHIQNVMVKIKIRLAYHKGNLVEVDTYKMKASQANHITGEYMFSDLKNRWKELVPGTFVQRDLYSAFLLFNAKNKEEIDFELCEQTFDNFFDGHNRLIAELREH